jgi:hypothetical protein
MVSIDRVLSEFIDDWNAGRRPQVDAYLERVPEDERAALADQLMTWLEVAPTPAYDGKTRAEIRSEPVARASIDAMASEAGLWPELLPRLRERASLSVRELAGKLVAAIGLGSNAEPKTSDYLDQLERGSLDPARVSQTVIEKPVAPRPSRRPDLPGGADVPRRQTGILRDGAQHGGARGHAHRQGARRGLGRGRPAVPRRSVNDRSGC